MDAFDIGLLRERLNYDCASGVIVWRTNPSNPANIGKEAGWLEPNGYRRIHLQGRHLLVHRIAWAMHYDVHPPKEIDHINGVRSDNRIDNLRSVSRSENQQNIRQARRNSACGLLGVNWHKPANKWRAKISVNGNSIHLGLFKSAEEAHAAYLEAKKIHHSGVSQ